MDDDNWFLRESGTVSARIAVIPLCRRRTSCQRWQAISGTHVGHVNRAAVDSNNAQSRGDGGDDRGGDFKPCSFN